MTAYPEAKDIYWKRGWCGVLPLHHATKSPLPVGFSGKDGAFPTYDDLVMWEQVYPDGNICLRLTDEIVGIDVDAYGTKTGAQTLAEAEKRWGPLPPTYRATSREDGISGIRLFRVPAGTKLRGLVKFTELGIGDVEIIQHHHRYVVCWPSIHDKTGLMYLWFDEAAGLVVIDIPPSTSPAIPTREWQRLLRVGPTPTRNCWVGRHTCWERTGSCTPIGVRSCTKSSMPMGGGRSEGMSVPENFL